jgi:hypothetical protein
VSGRRVKINSRITAIVIKNARIAAITIRRLVAALVRWNFSMSRSGILPLAG